MPSVSASMQRLASFLLAVAAVLAGCGSSPHPSAHAKSRRQPPSGISAAAAACFPGWEQTDLRIAQAAKLPVPMSEIVGTGGAATALTLENLPIWLGDAPGTPLTSAALLKGFTLQGQAAIGPVGVLAVQGSPLQSASGTLLYVEEVGLTRAQRRALTAAGADPPGGPVTLVIPVPSQHSPATVPATLGMLLASLEVRSPLSAQLYAAVPNPPSPSHYLVPGAALRPAALLSRLKTCTAGPAFYLQETGGLLEPVPVFLAQDQGGIAFGFTQGYFVVALRTTGASQIYWYTEPEISVSAQ